jgi:hypothetical protein
MRTVCCTSDLSANAPPSGSIPVTIGFHVRRVEESADLERAQANIPEPTGAAFAAYLGPDRLVPIDGQIKLVSAKVAIRTLLRTNRPGPSTTT